jgi:nucleotide-binding universal stress UspA family protein
MSTGEFARILVPTDFSACAEEAWATAQRLARALDADLVLVHVVMEAAVYSGAPFARGLAAEAQAGARKWADEQLQRWAETARAAGLEVRTELRTGVVHEQIVDAATETRADLIVLGTHGHGGLKRAVLGSVADRVIRLGPCPVMSVPEPA